MPLVIGKNAATVTGMTNVAALDSLIRITGPALVDRLNAGVKASAFSGLASAIDVSVETLASFLGLSARTIRTRKVLSADETERAFRAYRVLVRAREVLESEQGAREWLRTPQRALGDRVPLALIERDVGAQEVLNVLAAIEDGGYL